MPPLELADASPQKSFQQAQQVYRVDVLPMSLGVAEKRTVPGLGELYSHPVYWLQGADLKPDWINRIAKELLIDPILQTYSVSNVQSPVFPKLPQAPMIDYWVFERQFLPGVTDNLGKTVERNISLLFPNETLPDIKVASGEVFWSLGTSLPSTELAQVVEYQLYNPLIQKMTIFPASEAGNQPARYHFPNVGSVEQVQVETISLELSDEALLQLSKSRCLALTLEEMKVIQTYFQRDDVKAKRQGQGLPQWPTDVELEIIAQTWSEHCKHKIFAAKIEYTDASDPDFPITRVYDGLFKTFIAGATKRVQEKRPDLLSVFKDNAGVVKWNDTYAVCFKVETHNSPSALEPYGGALTGIVGVNRDILGTGLGAKPLFNTDVFCFAHPDEPHADRPTMLPAEAILQGVRKGVEDGGNKSGIPTVNGALVFDPRYRAKPLVFCGTGGLLPLKVDERLGYEKYTEVGDTIVMAGGRVGKDGIHGATFSSEALHEDSPVSAVQIGDPITQKRMMDFMMEARDLGLISGVTDNGAGGLSSSVGEMAELTNGATIHVEKVPLKYPGLAPYEVVISESQERMTFSTSNMHALEQLAKKYDVELTSIGEFHDQGAFNIVYHGKLIASLDLDFLHNGLPQMNLKAHWTHAKSKPIRAEVPDHIDEIFLKMMESPNLCSREALIRQYDHEVQGRSVIKPLMGPDQTAPCDAAVLQPILGEPEGLVISNGICPQYGDWDTYNMAACAVDEAVRNAIAVGADPKSIALLDNFCWPDPLPSPRNPDAEFKLAQLVRANMALYDLAVNYGTPLISGKDSMKNDFDDGVFRLSIPPTLLVSAIGKIPDISKAISMEFKRPGDTIFLVGRTNLHMGASEYYRALGWYSQYAPYVHVAMTRRLYPALYQCMQQGWVRSCHDLSEGGLGVALAESVLGGRYGASINLHDIIDDSPELRWDEALFSETPGRFLVSVAPENAEAFSDAFRSRYLPVMKLGQVTEDPTMTVRNVTNEAILLQIESARLRAAWQKAPARCYSQEGEQ